ncbi:MAG: glutamine amidotransferase [Parvicellaceae bacterium]|jgi:glutamine amidotransferase
MKVAIIDYGAGNVQSVKFALKRVGVEAIVTDDLDIIKGAERVIFPGVGEASAAMSVIRSKGLDQVIRELTQPVLGICLGMQLMCTASAEGDTAGLGIFEEKVLKFEPFLKVPQMGWNRITDVKSELLEGVEKEHMYFVHSYFVPKSKYTIASCDYIEEFSAALHKDNFYACQFHPEKSGAKGAVIIENFLKLD